MKKETRPEVKLVITAALKKELPLKWLQSSNIPVMTLSAVLSGASISTGSGHSGLLVLITGPGPASSERAACWIRDHLRPLFVVNVGTCGVGSRAIALGKWIQPQSVANSQGDRLNLDTRLPFPHGKNMISVSSLVSVDKALSDFSTTCAGKRAAVDMEAYSQAWIFQKTPISFHCLKFSTDYGNDETQSDFDANLPLFRESLKSLLGFARECPEDVAVIIPVHNREETVGRAIESVLCQTVLPSEIIVVDDGSTDGTGDVLKTYGSRITSLSLRGNFGPATARNRGISQARSRWVAFLDSDDMWSKDKLEKQRAFLKTYPFFQIIQSDEIWIRQGRRVNPCKHHRKPEGWIWEQSLQRCLVSPSAVLARKKLLESFGAFDESLRACEDYDLWLQVSRYHPVGLDRSLSVLKYGGHDDQLSRRYPAMDRFRIASLMKQLEGERHPLFRERITGVLEKKLKILIGGCEKRNKDREAREYRTVLYSLPV